MPGSNPLPLSIVCTPCPGSKSIQTYEEPPLCPIHYLEHINSTLHTVIEHDASFSRHDAGDGDGDGVTFSPSVWGSTARHFTDATISILNVADALRDRVFSESSLDPMFNFTEIPRQTVLNEVATALLMFWGGSEDGGVNTVQVNTFFVDERIPFDKNYVSPASRIFPVNITTVGEKVNASLPLDLPFVPML